MRGLSFLVSLALLRSFMALEGTTPRGDHLPLTGLSRKQHTANTPFRYCLLPWLLVTLLRELSCGIPSSSECHLGGGTMTAYRIRFKEQLDQRWSAWLGGLTVVHEANGE